MEPLKEDIERVIDRLHEKARRSKADTKVFAAIAREYALQIQSMRKEGYSYIEICSAFEQENLLPANANVESLRQACRRQLARLVKKETRPVPSKSSPLQVVEKPEKIVPPQEVTTQDQDIAALEKERLMRKIGGRKVETPNGTITKYPDGGFAFD